MSSMEAVGHGASVVHVGTRNAVRASMIELQCPICLDELTAPVQTSCGHSFCEGCIRTALDHSRECPVCRHPISSHRSLRANSLVANLTGAPMPRSATIESTEACSITLQSWQCNRCTLRNVLAAGKCSACGARRPVAVVRPALSAKRAVISAPLARKRKRDVEHKEVEDEEGEDDDVEVVLEAKAVAPRARAGIPINNGRGRAPENVCSATELLEQRRSQLAPEALSALQAAADEGLTIMLSSKSNTGFFRVYYCATATETKKFSAIASNGKHVFLGHFLTAEEAAVAFARSSYGQKSVALHAHEMRREMEVPPTAAECHQRAQEEGLVLLTAANTSGFAGVVLRTRGEAHKNDERRFAALVSKQQYEGRYRLPEQAALVYVRTAEGRAECAKRSQKLSASEALRLAEEEGLVLERSSNISGFRCVAKQPCGSRYQVQFKKTMHLGYYPTAEEGALVLARYKRSCNPPDAD